MSADNIKQRPITQREADFGIKCTDVIEKALREQFELWDFIDEEKKVHGMMSALISSMFHIVKAVWDLDDDQALEFVETQIKLMRGIRKQGGSIGYKAALKSE